MSESLKIPAKVILDDSKARRSLDTITKSRDIVLSAKLDARSIASANKPLGAIKRSADEFEKSMGAANARVLAFGTSVAVIEGMRRSFLALIKTTAEVEKSLTQIQVVAGDELKSAGISIEKVGGQIFDLAKKTGQSFDSASKSFLEFARQGLKPVQTLERTKTALELVRISGAEQEKVIGGLTAAYNAFSSSGLSFSKIAEKLVNVDNKTTTSVEGLVDVLARASSTAKLTGTSFEELLAVTATLKDVTARSESVIGNAYRSISARLIDPQILKNLEELGVKTREFDGGPLLKTIGILTNVGEKLKEISDPSLQTEIVKSISGLYQFDQLTALISALQDVNNLQGFYRKNLKASTDESTSFNDANEAFSKTLINKFNEADVSITQVLNSLGKLGVKDPLSNILDGFNDLASGITSTLDGSGIVDKFSQAVVKGLGGALFGPQTLLLIGGAIAKIVFEFGKFALQAGQSFLHLNKTAKEQELLQKSILTTISQMPSILKGVENTEQGRLLLAQRISVEYEKQLRDAALLNQLTAGAAPKVYGQGFRIGDAGLKKVRGATSAKGYLPDLVDREMSDVRKGVGGANSNSKIIVMPNFPFGGGQKGLMVANSSEKIVKTDDGYAILNQEMIGGRAASGFLAGQKPKTTSGKFASVNNLEVGLDNLIRLLVGLDRGTVQIKEAAKNFARSFNLNEKSLDLVVDASVRYASSVKEAEIRIARETNQDAIRKAIGRADQTVRSAPEKRGSFTPPIIIPGGGNFLNRPSPRAIENALKESSLKMIVDAAESANQKILDGILDKRKRIAEYIEKNPPNPLSVGLSRTSLSGRDLSGNPTFAYLNQPVRFSGPSNSDPFTRATEIGRQREIERLATQPRGLSISPSLVESARIRNNYENNPTAAFGGAQRIAALNLPSTQAMPAETVKKAGQSLEQFATKAFLTISAVEFLTSTVRGTSETVDKFANAISSATLGLFALQGLNRLKGASGLSKVLPLLGQIGVVAFGINEVSKFFSDKSLFDRAREALGGLSDVGEKTRAALDAFAQNLYQNGQFIGANREQRISQSTSQRNIALQQLKADSLGIKGDTPEQTGSNLLRNDVKNALSKIITGREANPNDSLTEAFVDTSVLSRVTGDARENLISGLAVLAAGTAQELSEDLSKLGVKKIDGQDIDKAPIERAREVLIQKFIENLFGPLIKDNKVNLQEIFSGNKGVSNVFGYVEKFLGGDSSGSTAKSSPSGPNSLESIFGGVGAFLKKIPKEKIENIFDLQIGLQNAVVDGAISSIESQIRTIETSAGSGLFSEQKKNELLNQIPALRQKIFESQLKSAETNFEAEKIKISGNDKLAPQEQIAQLDLLKQKYKNQTDEINRSSKAVKDETIERNKSIRSLSDFNLAISSLDTVISSLSSLEAGADAKINLLQARSGNPSLSTGAQENFQRLINQEQINKLKTVNTAQSIARLNQALVSADNEKDEIKQGELRKQALNAFDGEIKAINGQVDVINESTKQIGATKSSFISLNDAILQFTRGLGDARGQNQFNLLQATDAGSLSSGLIGEQVYGAAGNRSGAELVAFIADQNALLNEQFKIRTATSETERLDLERQLDLTTQILAIKNSDLSISEKQAAIESAINANLEKRRTFASGLQESYAGMRDQVNNFGNEFGKTTTNAFRDGLSDAIKAAVSQTDNLKDAFLDIALSFANKLRDAAIDNLVNSLMVGSKSSGGGGILGGILGLFGGGKTKGYATGGYVSGGSGIKDDILAKLMGGEFVMSKKAVSNIGVPALSAMNNGYFAPGVRGQGSIIGKDNLLDFATQTATGGAQDIRRNLAGGAGMVSLEPESLRASNYQRFGDSPIVQATQDAKEQAFGLYMDQIGQEKQYQEELNQYYEALNEQKKAQKAKIKELLISLGISLVGGAISGGFGGGKSSGKGETAFKSGSNIRGVSERPIFSSSGRVTQSSNLSSNFGIPFRNAPSYSGGTSSYNPYKATSFDFLNYGKDILGIYGGYGNSDLINRSVRSPYRGYEDLGATYLLPSVNYQRRNSGGYGAGNGDTNPAMLSSKEFVLNSSAAKKLGDKNLYALNSGATPSGGSDDSAVVARLDELIEKTVAASNVNITVNMSKDGEQSSENSDGQTQNGRLLGDKIRGAVLQVIRDEKRTGGLLAQPR